MKPAQETTIKPGEVSKTLGVTGVTVRHYVKEFSQFLSPDATNATNRKFTPEDVKVLRLASSLLREGYTYQETRERLVERLPLEGEVFEGAPAEEPVLEPPPAPSSAIQPLEFFQAFVETLREEHQAHVETLKTENARLQAEVNWLRLPWWVKLFRKPPGTP